VNRRGGTRQVVDLLHLDEERLGDIVPHDFEPAVIQQMLDVFSSAGEEVVETGDAVTFGKEPFAKMRADEAGATGYEDAHDPGSCWRMEELLTQSAHRSLREAASVPRRAGP
jgi:hypothetical protein